MPAANTVVATPALRSSARACPANTPLSSSARCRWNTSSKPPHCWRCAMLLQRTSRRVPVSPDGNEKEAEQERRQESEVFHEKESRSAQGGHFTLDGEARNPRSLSVEGRAEPLRRTAHVGHSGHGCFRHAQHQEGHAHHRVSRSAYLVAHRRQAVRRREHEASPHL